MIKSAASKTLAQPLQKVCQAEEKATTTAGWGENQGTPWQQAKAKQRTNHRRTTKHNDGGESHQASGRWCQGKCCQPLEWQQRWHKGRNTYQALQLKMGRLQHAKTYPERQRSPGFIEQKKVRASALVGINLRSQRLEYQRFGTPSLLSFSDKFGQIS